MRNVFFIVCTTMVCMGASLIGQAQERKIRDADVFWKKRIVNRISLIEKINRPLVAHADSYFGDDSPFKETNGLVVSLINGVKSGKYTAYHPDEWEHQMEYAELRERMEEFERDLNGVSTQMDETDVFDMEDPFLQEENAPTDDLSESRDDASEEAWPFEDLESGSGTAEPVTYIDNTFDYTNFEQVIHIVEDWIFDKGTSEMVQRIAFFEVIWVDPSGVLPERVLARFKWDEVKEQLEETQWTNFHNAGESKSMKDIIALRRFNSLIIHLGNRPIRSLHEAIHAKRELVEFEHNLWSY